MRGSVTSTSRSGGSIFSTRSLPPTSVRSSCVAGSAATTTTVRSLIASRRAARNSAATSFFAVAWDGRTADGLVPDGFYTLRLSILKALGDENNPAHYETFTTPVIRVLTAP